MHFKVWIAITSFLHFICQQDISPDGDPKADQLGVQCCFRTCSANQYTIAAVFAPVLFRADNDSTFTTMPIVGMRRFVKLYIT
jgi:hypothetical protein